MPASRRKTTGHEPARRGRPRTVRDEADHDQPPEPPTPDAPGQPVPAVPAPGQQEGYRPVLPPLGEAITEAREADGEVAAEQLTRPSAALASIRRHLAKLMAALDQLQQREAPKHDA